MTDNTVKNAALYGGAATGLVATTGIGLVAEKRGVAGFIGMTISFVIFVCCMFYSLDSWAHNDFKGFFSWFFLVIGFCYGYLFFRNFFHFTGVIIGFFMKLFGFIFQLGKRA